MYNVSTVITRRVSRQVAASGRASFRIDPRVKAIIEQAARTQRANFSEFVVNSSLAAAESVLAARTRFVLPPGQWKKFVAALDAPPREIPALRKLLAEPSVFGRA